MSIEFTSNNHYLQVGTNHGNIHVFTEPRSASHSEHTLHSKVSGSIDAATIRALDQALVNFHRYLGIVQRDISLHSRIMSTMTQIGSLLLSIKELKPEQWGSLGSEIVSNVFSLLYCCTIDCRELSSTPLTNSPFNNGLTACHLALHCVYCAALMDPDGIIPQQQKLTETMEQLSDMEAQYAARAEQPGLAIYHFQRVLGLLKRSYVPDCKARSGVPHVSFGEGNRGVQAVEYHGSMRYVDCPL